MSIGKARERISEVIASKLNDFFELADYDWTPKSREDGPSMYLFELAHWLSTVVDSLVVQDAYKDDAYRIAVSYVADCLMVSYFTFFVNLTIDSIFDTQDFIAGSGVTMLNENALSNILVDVDFLEGVFKKQGREHVNDAFTEIRLVCLLFFVFSYHSEFTRCHDIDGFTPS